jgi:predicted PurR-regulated permease PerM
MSNEDTRREIEKLRAQMEALSAGRQKDKTVGRPAENRGDRECDDKPVVDVGSNDLADDAEVPNKPARDAQELSQPESFRNKDKSDLRSSAQVAYWTIILGAIIALLVVGRTFLVPLAIALLLWNLLNALSNTCKRIQIGKSQMPGWLAWTVALVVLFLANALVYKILTSQSDALIAAAPVYEANFSKLTDKVTALIGIERMPSTSQLMESLDMGAMLSWLGGSVGSFLSEFILIMLYVAFLLVEQKYFPAKITRLASNEENAAKAKMLMGAISKQVQTYMGIKTVVSLLTGFVSYIVLRLVGVDFAAVWALLIFLLNFIPNVGSAMGVLFPALLTLVQFDTLTPFVIILIGLGAVQFIIGNVVEPAMMGSSLNLSSFVIILSLTFWGIIWGIPGMILCVPITVIVAIICSHFERFHWIAVLLSTDGRVASSAENN